MTLLPSLSSPPGPIANTFASLSSFTLLSGRKRPPAVLDSALTLCTRMRSRRGASDLIDLSAVVCSQMSCEPYLEVHLPLLTILTDFTVHKPVVEVCLTFLILLKTWMEAVDALKEESSWKILERQDRANQRRSKTPAKHKYWQHTHSRSYTIFHHTTMDGIWICEELQLCPFEPSRALTVPQSARVTDRPLANLQ